MFRFKKEQIQDQVAQPHEDSALLIELMDKAVAGDFSQLDTSQFQDPSIAAKYNEVLATFVRLNNNFVMRLNESMKLIGDSKCVKDMIEEVFVVSITHLFLPLKIF